MELTFRADLDSRDPAPHDGWFALYACPAARGAELTVYQVVVGHQSNPGLDQVLNFCQRPKNRYQGYSEFWKAAWFVKGQTLNWE